jgi:uncharacterized protein with gpF-like domain
MTTTARPLDANAQAEIQRRRDAQAEVQRRRDAVTFRATLIANGYLITAGASLGIRTALAVQTRHELHAELDRFFDAIEANH